MAIQSYKLLINWDDPASTSHVLIEYVHQQVLWAHTTCLHDVIIWSCLFFQVFAQQKLRHKKDLLIFDPHVVTKRNVLLACHWRLSMGISNQISWKPLKQLFLSHRYWKHDMYVENIVVLTTFSCGQTNVLPKANPAKNVIVLVPSERLKTFTYT